MPIKAYGRGVEPAVHRWAGGLTWIAHPGESMERASHAIAVDDEGVPVTGADRPADPDVWLIEPLDVEGLDALLAELGTVAGVVVLATLHRRDAAALAARHDAPICVPAPVSELAPRIDAPVAVFAGRLPGTSFRAVPTVTGIPWNEAALYDEATGTLVATEALVTGDRTTGPGERLAVGAYARLTPPRDALGALEVERVLVGHGPPLLDGAQAALDDALANARRGLPAYIRWHLGYMLRAGYVAMRD